MSLLFISSALSVVAAAFAMVIIVHAFRRSVGTGVMVLCIPCYVLHYAFTQFDPARRSWVVPCWLGALGLAVVTGAIGVQWLAPLPVP